MKKPFKFLLFVSLLFILLFSGTLGASAASKGFVTKKNGYTYYYKANGTRKTGWLQKGSSWYYFRKKKDSGGPKYSMVTGFYKVKGNTYYFSSSGKMRTGWRTIKGNIYYFKKSGGKGTKGRMYTGLKKIGGYYFYFNSSGKMQTGWQTISGRRYYFKKKGSQGKRGHSYTGWTTLSNKKYYFAKKGYVKTGFQTISGKKYYFNSKGVMQTGWVTVSGKKYYLNSKGVVQTGFQTISGKKYYFNSKGVMQTGWMTVSGKKYYLNSGGVVQTGWKTIDGKKYYFDSNGVMAVSTTVNGIKIGSDGVAATKTVLIVAGHGQGDPGATSTIAGAYYQESTLTREFANIVYDKLVSSSKPVNAVMYDQNYDWYKVNGGAAGPKITWSDYDFILEIHFNATEESSKDLKGNGSYKGMGIYVHSSNSDTKIDKAILSAVKSKTGFKIWGGGSGIFIDSSLRNPRLAEENSVSYGLLETCFIDDKDDMDFYNARKYEMATGVVNGIIEGLGL